MAGSGEGGRKWFKYGCFGCLGCLGLLILISVGVTGVAWIQSRSAEAEDEVITREIPGLPSPEIPAATEETPDPELQATATTPGHVILDLGQGEVQVRPGEPGEPIRIEARYDKDDCRLEESFEEGDGSGWTYRVKFRRFTTSGLLTSIKEAFAGTSPRVVVYLPVDVPLKLDLGVRQGGGEIELGGLWLTDADIEFEMGGGELRFSEPLRHPMNSLSVSASMGGGAFQKIGNASPRQCDFDFRMGGMQLDLRGQWLQDSDISIRHSMGGGAVFLPDGVRLDGVPGRADTPPETGEVPQSTLRFTVSSEMGNLEFVDW
jgi:hypothetical protein